MNAMRLLDSTAPSLRRAALGGSEWTPWRDLSHVVVEICTENAEGIRLSARAGADRAELCDNLVAGGTTPSIGSVEAAVFAAAEEVEARRAQQGAHWASLPDAGPVGLQIMIRPRGGGYVFTPDERRTMIADVRRIAALAREMSEYTRPQRTAGAGRHLPPAVEIGFVLGALTPEHCIDRGLLRLLIDTADGAPVTFNKAIDETRDPIESYGDLGGLGVAAVLTSGGAPSALEGAQVLQGMVAAGGSEGPRVIASGGITAETVGDVIAASGVREVHLRCASPDPQRGGAQRTSEAEVRRAVEIARRL